ncbi:MAG: DUF5062 family protein [Candidatus Endonucleobacter bathymodioli]|uniref:DUF5062 family protein n=1 Tax=Candidatus Endonucleibacter bathymodioli TaxID=539814 RepID=A0AA90P0B3_9GAMM|nr:DUF5062 family protein [Candidatus Endonucleobacter bathymodioli]
MKKLKNESELVKEALRIGAIYVEKRKAGCVDSSDSAKKKVEFIYRILVHDKLIQPLEKKKENEPSMKRKLALWITRQLPQGHKLLN